VFSNPLVGVLVGVVITAIIQSSSASIGILQALSMTGGITYGTAIPIIMGQNIGTCISALISCIGASKNAKRAALIHLLFNIFSALICLPLYYIVYSLLRLTFADMAVTPLSIAMVNTVYKLVSINHRSIFQISCTSLSLAH
jgi:phosphate:Na+ symporter